MSSQKNKLQQDIIYLLELTPNSEHILEKISVQRRVEEIFYECAQTLNFQIDSCDVMFDFIAITLYVQPSSNVEDLIMNLHKQSSRLVVKDFIEFKQYLNEDSLWSFDCNLELLS